MAYVRIWVHVVWGTKNSVPLLTKDLREKLFHHILQNAKQKQIRIDCINGYTDHVHCLLQLNADKSIAQTMQLIKGESAFWVNREKLIRPKLEWAEGYYAGSVDDRGLSEVRKYIHNQEEHHRKKSFMEEYDEFMKEYSATRQG